MDVTVTGRRMEITDQLRDYVEKKVAKLGRLYPALIETGVIIEQDRFQYVTEISVHSKPFDLFGRGQHANLKQSVLSAVRKVERQLLKQKDRLQEHKGRSQ